MFADLLDTRKMRDVRTIILAAVSRRDLCYVSENEGKQFSPNTHFGDGAAAAEEFSEDLHPPIPSHPGMKYPVRAPPSLRCITRGFICSQALALAPALAPGSG